MKLNNNDDSHNSGLNLLIYNMLLDIESHPAWVCGLKHLLQVEEVLPEASHPAWVCGLKLTKPLNTLADKMSHPAWVCGLKQGDLNEKFAERVVTPCVGVWIETLLGKQEEEKYRSHPAWVCGLKLLTLEMLHLILVTPCVGVWIETSIFLYF